MTCQKHGHQEAWLIASHIEMGRGLQVSSHRLVKLGIEPANPGLQGKWFIIYTMAAPIEDDVKVDPRKYKGSCKLAIAGEWEKRKSLVEVVLSDSLQFRFSSVCSLHVKMSVSIVRSLGVQHRKKWWKGEQFSLFSDYTIRLAYNLLITYPLHTPQKSALNMPKKHLKF